MRRVLLSICSLVVLCAVLEVVLRTTHLFHARLSWTEPDREIGWRFTPGREYWFFAENDHPITGRINSMGWRDRERPEQKPPGTRRIAVLGDSFVEGFQVELDSTFSAILERNLTAGGTNHVEVMNFGRSGMCPTEELIVLERDVLPRAPDVVVMMFTPHNDITDVNPVTAGDACRPFFHRVHGDSLVLDTAYVQRRDFRIRALINPLKQTSALVSLLTERYNTARMALRQRQTAPSAPGGLSGTERMCTAHPDSLYTANYELCRLLITRMARECSVRHIQFVLASVPFVYDAEFVRERRREDATFDPGFFDRDLGALAASQGMDFVPLTEFFEPRRMSTVQWAHWNYHGHRLVAAALGRALAPGDVHSGIQNK